MNLRQLLFLKAAAGSSGKYVEITATGNPATFSTNAIKALNEFTIPLSCSQSGSGDPSPSNVRPITGYSGIGISHFSTNEVVATAAESTSNGLNWKVTADGTVIYNGNPTAYSGRNVGNYYVKGNETIHCYLLGDIDNIKFDDAMIYDESGTRLATISSGWSGKKTPQNQGTIDLSEYPTAYRVQITVCRNQNNVDMNGVCIPVVGEDLSIPDSYNIAFPALGKNLWDGNGLINGTTNGQGKYTGVDTKRVISPLIFLGAGTFTLSCAEEHPVAVYAFSENNEDTFVAGDSLTSWQTSSTTFTLTTAKYVRFKWKNQSDTTFSPSDITKLQIERAINILQNKTAERGATSIYIGQDTANVYPNHLVAGTVYSMSYECDGTNAPQIYIQENGESAVLAGNGKKFTFSPVKTGDYRMYVYVQGGVTSVTNFQLSTATKYEPYNNTVYGGTLDVAMGVLSIELVKYKLSDFGWAYSTYNDANVFRSDEISNIDSRTNRADVICDKLASENTITSYASAANWGNYTVGVYRVSENTVRLFVKDTDTTSQSAFITQFGSAEIVLKLNTPVTVQLDPVTIRTMIGTNTIWTNTNGSNTIKYLKKQS